MTTTPLLSLPLAPFFFPEFESIKNRLEQRNERPPISHRIMPGPIGPGEKANHGWASRLLLGVKNEPRGALSSLSRGRARAAPSRSERASRR